MGSANANRLRTYLMLMVTVVWMQVADNARRALDSDPLVQGCAPRGLPPAAAAPAFCRRLHACVVPSRSARPCPCTLHAPRRAAHPPVPAPCGPRPSRSDQESATEAVLAGAILTLIFNFLYIIYWGLTDHGAQSLSLSRSAVRAPGRRGATAQQCTAQPNSQQGGGGPRSAFCAELLRRTAGSAQPHAACMPSPPCTPPG